MPHPARTRLASATIIGLTGVAVVVSTAAPSAAAAPQNSVSGTHGSGTRHTLQEAADTLVRDGAVGVTLRARAAHGNVGVAAGVRDQGGTKKAAPHDRFHVASNTKSMTAVLVMQQIERGRWKLDTTVQQIWPGLLGAHSGTVTLRQLLGHQSGIPDGVGPAMASHITDPNSWTQFVKAQERRYTDREILSAALAQPWVFAPGTKASYSNTGYIVLGMLLERATGQPMPRLMAHGVFRKAGMRHSHASLRSGIPGPSLSGAFYGSDGAWYSLKRFNPSIFSSAGNVVSTTEDLTRFNRALLSGRLVSTKSLRQMQQTHSVDGMDYGLGIYRLPDPCTPQGKPQQYIWGHDGGTYGTLSFSIGSPDGRRQVSFGVTGRDLSNGPTTPQPYDLNAALLAALRTTCGTPTTTPRAEVNLLSRTHIANTGR